MPHQIMTGRLVLRPIAGANGDAPRPDHVAITLDGELIGGTGTSDHLGRWIAPDFWRQGFAQGFTTETAGAMVDHFFETEPQDVLRAGPFEGNHGSARA